MIFQVYINPIMILIELLFQIPIVYFSFYLIYREIGRTSITEKNLFNRSAFFTCLILLILTYIIKILFQILQSFQGLQFFGLFDKPYFLIAIQISLFIKNVFHYISSHPYSFFIHSILFPLYLMLILNNICMQKLHFTI